MKKKNIRQRIIEKFALKVFAEEGGDTKENQQLNYEDLVKNARQEEQGKAKKEIDKLKTDLKEQIKINNDLLIKNAELAKEIETNKGTEKDETIRTLETEIQSLKDELQKFEGKEVNEETLRNSIEQELRERFEKEYEVKLYLQEQKDKNKSNVIDLFLEEITGSTKEEVDEAINKAIEKTKKIKESLGIKESNHKKDKQNDKEKERLPQTNPEQKQDDGYSLEDIRNLDPKSDEYKEFRKKLGLK